MKSEQRVQILRNYEVDCYSICYYLLRNEEKAEEAAKLALIDIFRNDAFFQHSENRGPQLQKSAIRAALVSLNESQWSDK